MVFQINDSASMPCTQSTCLGIALLGDVAIERQLPANRLQAAAHHPHGLGMAVQARQSKARVLRQLDLSTLNTNWRHWYLSSALELEGRYDSLPFNGNGLAARDIWMSVEPRQLLRNLGVRLRLRAEWTCTCG